MGIELVLGQGVTAIEQDADGRASGVRIADGRTLPADLVVLGLGVRPDVAPAKAGRHPARPVGRREGRPTHAHGGRGRLGGRRLRRVGAPTEWPAGGRRLGTHANKQGRVAGINLGGGYATFPGVIGTAVTKVCDLEVARTGLSEPEARLGGYRYVTASVDSTTRAGYSRAPSRSG